MKVSQQFYEEEKKRIFENVEQVRTCFRLNAITAEQQTDYIRRLYTQYEKLKAMGTERKIDSYV